MSKGNASRACQIFVLGFILVCAIDKFVEGRCRVESTSGVSCNKKWASRL